MLHSQTAAPARIGGSVTTIHRGATPTYKTLDQALAAYDGDDPLYVLYPRKVAAAAHSFLTGFPGRVLYAVKANPNPAILQMLWAEGVRNFDVASMREIALIGGLFPDARMYLMHPVKSRALIAKAYAMGVRDFAYDSAAELEKIFEETGGAKDLNLHLRLALPKGDAVMPLVGKFGARFEDAVLLLAGARSRAAALGLCFHVGSQCLNAASYDEALGIVRRVVDAAGVAIDSIDVGGGFPVAYPGMNAPPLVRYFDVIGMAVGARGFDGVTVMGEPGRAMVAEGGSTLARIELRKGEDLHLNDGVYGSLFDAGQFAWQYPLKAHRKGAPAPTGEKIAFRFFGPTCDSHDTMSGPYYLPADIAEGDFIEIGNLGAYGQSLAGRFNGFYSQSTAAVLDCD